MSDDRHPVEEAIAKELRLRPERPPVTRLSRKVLAGLAGIGGLAVLGALIWALDTGKREGEAPQELYTTENTTTSDRLQQLPRDYTEVPKLGPPLPGDLGRPILRSRERDGLVDTPLSQPDPEEQRRRQEAEAARKSGLFASGVRPTASEHTRSAVRPARQVPARCRPAIPTRCRTCRTASSPSSTPPSIAALSAPTAWPARPRPSCCRPARSSRPRSSPESAPTFPARSPRR